MVNVQFNNVQNYSPPHCENCDAWNDAAGFDVPMNGCAGKLDTGICAPDDKITAQILCVDDEVTFQVAVDTDTVYRLTVAGNPADCLSQRTLNRLSAYGASCYWNGSTCTWTPQ